MTMQNDTTTETNMTTTAESDTSSDPIAQARQEGIQIGLDRASKRLLYRGLGMNASMCVMLDDEEWEQRVERTRNVTGENALRAFLLDAFTVDELRAVLRNEYREVAYRLPVGPVSPADFMGGAARLLLSEEPFRMCDVLTRERPRLAFEIARLRVAITGR